VFDRFVVVDWSANSTPKLGRDSIWIARCDASDGSSTVNLPTRAAATGFLIDLIESDPTASMLIGVDFSLGYPAGTAAALGLTGTEWSAMWDLLASRITDDDRNVNNRFTVAAELNERLSGTASPFWGCPPSARSRHLSSTKPSTVIELAEFRAVEALLRARGARPFSSWQLLGAGAVGSQSLVGIARMDALRQRVGDRLHIWPFTTGLTMPPLDRGAVVLVEIWPSMYPTREVAGEVRDAAQVRTTARWLVEADASGVLDAYFSPSPSCEVARAAVAEEGWMFGVMG
jgi:precorrin-8X/cobalt-precorrin-8 methylmutase